MTEDLQRTDEWFQARIGKATASKVADIIARTKSGYGASRANYRAALVSERLTGVSAEGFTNAAMQWGTDMEPTARAAYEFMTGQTVDPVGFVVHPSIAMSGASPDGLVGDAGQVEIKCPNTATHIETLLSGTVPGKYATQMHWQMACTGRQWCDFVSFDPRLPENMQVFISRLNRDDVRIGELEVEVVSFLKEVDDTVRSLTERYGDLGAAA